MFEVEVRFYHGDGARYEDVGGSYDCTDYIYPDSFGLPPQYHSMRTVILGGLTSDAPCRQWRELSVDSQVLGMAEFDGWHLTVIGSNYAVAERLYKQACVFLSDPELWEVDVLAADVPSEDRGNVVLLRSKPPRSPNHPAGRKLGSRDWH